MCFQLVNKAAMKKFLLFGFLIGAITASAQNYLITFSGAGAANEVVTIEANNLSTGETLILSGGDTLNLTGPVGTSSYPISEKDEVTISPNPFNESSLITFASVDKQNVLVEIFDLLGSSEYRQIFLLEQGANTLEVSGLSKGTHLLRLSSKYANRTVKAISTGQSTAQPRVLLIGNSAGNSNVKSRLKSGREKIEMLYHNGDQMLYKGISGIYSTIVTDVPESSKTVAFTFIPCTDADTNNYTTVQIGDQRWMAENLNVGQKILGKWNQSNNSIIEKYCYEDLIENCDQYGGLYQWNEMKKFEYLTVQGICPENWRIPTLEELNHLAENLGGLSVAGGKLKETGDEHWASPNDGASNSSGFTALPGGMRTSLKNFSDVSLSGGYWSLTSHAGDLSPVVSLTNETGELIVNDKPRDEGYSVRCIHCDTLVYPGLTIAADENPVMFYNQATIRATPVNGGSNPRYQWKVNGLLAGYNSSVFTYWPTFSDTVSCEMTSNAVCVSGNPVKSNRIPIEITGPACPGTPFVVYAGETYNTVLLGDQCWLARNLNVGTKIDHTNCGPPNQTNNNFLEKYCLNNIVANCDLYGGLYTWGEAMNYGEPSSSNPSYVQGICPPMWHIPSKDEICELAVFLDPNFDCNINNNILSVNGAMLKEAGTTHWLPPNNGATNVTGFTARPTGCSDPQMNGFGSLDYFYIWTTTNGDINNAYLMRLSSQLMYMTINEGIGIFGIGVRCIKDF
jgi:uncharacterized protein (TIGR02145 family)